MIKQTSVNKLMSSEGKIRRKNDRITSNKKKIVIVSIIVMFLLLGNLLNHRKIDVNADYFCNNNRVDDTKINISNQLGPSIAIDNWGTIHVVWEDWRNDLDGRYISDGGVDGVNNADIYYANSTDGGRTFNINQRVNTNTDPSQQELPSIAVDGTGKIHVVWADWRDDGDGRFVSGGGIDGANNNDVYYTNSTDRGMTWSSEMKVNDDSGSAGQSPGFRCIAVDRNDKIHIVWLDQRNNPFGDIYYANSTDGGISFSQNKIINDVSIASNDPTLTVDDNDIVYVAWVDDRNDTTKSDIYFSKSMDGGISFTTNKKINDDNLALTYQGNPSIAANGGIVGLVWSDHRNQECIYFANSTNSGDSFSLNKRVDDDPFGKAKSRPSIAMNNSGYVYVAWRDKRNDNEDIYFANSTDGGNTFNTNQMINDDIGSSYQRFPSLALRNITVYVVWQDDRTGNWDVFFSRSNYAPQIAIPISPHNGSTITDNLTTLKVIPVIDQDIDTVYYNFTISDQSDAESGIVYYSGWITSASWKPPPLSDGNWYWHTYTSDMWNTTAPNWVWNFTIDTSQSYNIQLYEGWNLISIPFIQMDTNLVSVLDSINGSFDAVQWYNVYDASDSWKHYKISKSSHLNDLESINHKMGFWVHVTQPGGVLLQCSGIIPTENQSISLKTGWNLVGYPSLSNKTRDVALNNLTYDTEINAIWTYNASSQLWEQIGEFDNFERGRGYWIHAKTDCVWEVPL
ncbi:MAG: exo-alpha-sialidase [Thermoplasmata archaeon]|nr:MAG: exo-alpha-sialidase [Thermoplasmata archaeon]